MPVPTHGPDCETQLWPWNCPDCGKRVYYFSCSCGSRVFFDTKGPDWIQHEDTCPVYQVRLMHNQGIPPAAIKKMLFDRTGDILDKASYDIVLKFISRLEAESGTKKPVIEDVLPGIDPIEVNGIVWAINRINFFKRYHYDENPIIRAVLGEFAEIPHMEVIIREIPDRDSLQTFQYQAYIPEKEIIDPVLNVGTEVFVQLSAKFIADEETQPIWYIECIDWD